MPAVLALCGLLAGSVRAGDVYVALASDGCSPPAACTSVFRYDGFTSSLVFSQPATQGEIANIAADNLGNWFALVDDLAGNAALLRNGVTVAVMTGAPVELVVSGSGAAYAATQVSSPALLPGEVYRWDGTLQLVLTQPASVEPLSSVAVDRDDNVFTVTKKPAGGFTIFKNGVWIDGWGGWILLDFEISEDNDRYLAMDTQSGLNGGEVWYEGHGTHPVYSQPSALGEIDAIHVGAMQDVLLVSDDPSGTGPAYLIRNGAVLDSYTGFNRAIDVAIPTFFYPDAWTDLGGGLAGLLGIPVFEGHGTLAEGTPGGIMLSSAHGFAPSVLFVSLASSPVPFKGGTLVAHPFVSLLPLWTDFDGHLEVSWLAWPQSLPSGASMFLQLAVQDAQAVQGMALSNALEATAP